VLRGRGMKVLTINVGGIPSGSDSNLVSANVFQDYEAVVVDPEKLERLYGDVVKYADRDGRQLDLEFGHILFGINRSRREQVNGLLQRGGIVVCLMEPVERSYYEDSIEGESHYTWVTNYDWLFPEGYLGKDLGKIKFGKGQNIDVIDTNHPFYEYLSIKPAWLAYVDKDACGDWKVLASAFGTHAVSLTKRVGLGHIVLLPSYYEYDYGKLLEHCIVQLLGSKEIAPQPDWAKTISVPGQQELISKVTEISGQIGDLEKQRETLIGENENLEHWKYLLYEKGKHQLEPVVRNALALLGCNVEPQPDKDSDGSVTCDYGTALLEVVGSKGAIKIEKLGELTKNMGNFIAEKRSKVKGILVGNPFCEESLDNRPPKDTQKKLFVKELLESAEQQSITVLLTTDLYEVVSQILEDKLTDAEKQSLCERIFNGKGLVRLP
jgi:hypothetical protein